MCWPPWLRLLDSHVYALWPSDSASSRSLCSWTACQPLGQHITAAHTLVSATQGDSRVFCPDAEGQLIHTYTVTPTAALLPAPPQSEANQQPALPADLRQVDWDPTRPWHPRACRRRGRGFGTASTCPRPSPHRIDPRSWGFGSEPAQEYVVRTRASRLRTLRRMLSAPCGQPSGQHSMVMSTVASAAASSSSLSQMPQVLLASKEHQPYPLMPHGCIAASLVQLQSETDAPRSRTGPQPTPRQRVRVALRSDDTDVASLAKAHPSSSEWAHTWRAAHSKRHWVMDVKQAVAAVRCGVVWCGVVWCGQWMCWLSWLHGTTGKVERPAEKHGPGQPHD